MKAMPCDYCKPDGGALMVRSRPAAMLRDGTPYLMGRAPHRFPLRVWCARCKRATMVTAARFNGCPDLSLAELDEMGALQPLLKDLRGAGHSEKEAMDLFRFGWSPETLAALEPPEPRH